ncbi:hypothetical protein BVY03_01615 [bacterium K02(2017)]|nr:hypothetical protein BVY03_01615 [bacterium K02(2017)]
MIKIIPVKSKKEKKHFINLPYHLYKNEAHWIPPLKLERKEFFDPKKNPYFDNAKVQLFVAEKNGKTVGRISAQVNDLHNKTYQENTGHFGFFDCIDDQEVSRALFQSAENWLRMQGMDKIVGPFNFSINEESGILIKGHNSKPYPFMPFNFDYYQSLLEAQGLSKVKDLIAWNYDSTKPIPEPAMQIANMVKEYPGLTVREVDSKNIKRDVQIIRDVFNSAWSKNWGFIPWTDAEVEKMAKDFKMILDPKLALIAEVNGEPAAISIAIPNYHEAIHDLKGRLLPFGIVKFLYRLKTKKIKSARLALLGIKKEFRNDILAGLSVYLYTEMHRRSQELGHVGGELAWTLDDNDKINNGIAMMGGDPYKKYRLYEKNL